MFRVDCHQRHARNGLYLEPMEANVKKRKNKIFVTALVIVVSVSCLIGCTAQTGESSRSGSDGPGTYAHASMMAVHDEGVIDPDKEYAKKDCLSCHPRETIDAATADYGGEAGVNPHAAHTEAYECTTCHSITGVSSFKCNACHDWELPEGWENAPKESKVQ